MKIGILGGGQLGQMIFKETIGFDLELHFLDKSREFSVGKLAHHFHEGDFTKYEDVMAFAKKVDVLTIEIEKVNIQALHELHQLGKEIHPQPKALEIIQDKGLQKEFYQINEFPTSEFTLFDGKKDITQAIEDGNIQLPFVQKFRKGGYDGKGVYIVNKQEDIQHIYDTPSVIEPLVDIDKELAVIAVRNPSGEIRTYPVVEMVFDPIANLVLYLYSPAEVSDQQESVCRQIASELIEKMDISGLLAVEYFLTKAGDILINEVAPRPHNSGHHTMDAMHFSQFENHIRGVADLPIGSTEQHTPAAMVNIIGSDGYTGKPKYQGLDKVLHLDNVHLQLYNKSETRPNRKMGHFTVLGKDKADILAKVDYIREHFKVIA